MERTSVLIVGAGPIGLMMAILLKRCGIDFILIDQKSEPTTTSNALAIQARTLELWDTIQLAEEAIRRGHKIQHMKTYANGRVLLDVDTRLLQTQFPFLLTLPQSEIEHLLIERLESVSSKVQWNSKLISLKNDLTHTVADIQTPNGIVSIQSDWLIACDGYHSTVRPFIHTEYLGPDLTEHFIMMDVELHSDLPQNQVSAFFHPNGAFLMIPMKNKHRVIAEISHDPEFHTLKEADLAIFKKITQRRCTYPIQYKEPQWQSHFFVHERIATEYRHDRIFLMGDAAHAHSPAGGQGMNTGLQDAFNLAWKLALVIQKKSEDQLLNTYGTERRAVAKKVIDRTSQLTRLVSLKNSFLIRCRDFLLPWLAKKFNLAQHMATYMAELDICYKHDKNKLIGKRAAPFNTQYKFLLIIYHRSPDIMKITRWLSENYTDLMHVQYAEKKASPDFDYWVVRPDQYIGFVGNNFREFKNYWIDHCEP